jgi:hypothetical protein
LYLL